MVRFQGFTPVQRILTQPELIARELERADHLPETTAEDLALIDRRDADLTRQQSNLIDSLARVNGPSATLITEKLALLDREREALAHDREEISARNAQYERARKRITDVVAWCRTISDELQTFSYDEKRLAIDALGVSVRLWGADHDPRYEVTACIPLDGDNDGIVGRLSTSSTTE